MHGRSESKFSVLRETFAIRPYGDVMHRTLGFGLRVAAAMVVASSCAGRATSVDGGPDGGAQDSGTLGGAAEDSGIDAGAPDAGADGGVNGTGSKFLLGEECDPGLLMELTNSCRVELENPFQGPRCSGIRLPDGGSQQREEVLRFLEQGSVEACALFGAARLRCIAPKFPACVAARADGGRDLGVIEAAIDACDRQLGKRFDQPCYDSCSDSSPRCSRACDTTTIETCSACAMNCGKEFIACARRCLVLPDGGFPDAGR
jgi:hypothetical protein